MPLSPRDIRSQSFKKSILGYKTQEVDFFVEEIAKSIDDLRREIDHLKAEKEHTLERIENYEQQTSAVKETLELAREKGHKIIEDSKNSARQIITSAREEAQNILEKYQDEFNRRKMLLHKFKSISDAYKRRFHLMLEDTLQKMEDFERSIDSRKAIEQLDQIDQDTIIREPIEEWKWAQNSRFLRRK